MILSFSFQISPLRKFCNSHQDKDNCAEYGIKAINNQINLHQVVLYLSFRIRNNGKNPTKNHKCCIAGNHYFCNFHVNSHVIIINLRNINIMTKADIVNRIAVKSGISRKEVEVIVSNLMETLKSKMTEGENIYLRGFGSFIIKERAQKTARNISKNTTIIIPAHKIPAFKPSKEFVDNNNLQGPP